MTLQEKTARHVVAADEAIGLRVRKIGQDKHIS
jgi:hypothetical protein